MERRYGYPGLHLHHRGVVQAASTRQEGPPAGPRAGGDLDGRSSGHLNGGDDGGASDGRSGGGARGRLGGSRGGDPEAPQLVETTASPAPQDVVPGAPPPVILRDQRSEHRAK